MTDHLAPDQCHIGDVRHLAARLAPASVNCVVTSPPYYGLRSYLDSTDPRKAHEMGGEVTLAEYLDNLVGVFEALRPALHDSGVMFVNMGDSYANDAKWGGATGGKHAAGLHGAAGPGRARTASGLPPKSLLMVPARFAIAMQERGWVLRSQIRWCKKSAMPESVTDRPTSAVEDIFLFAKKPTYWYDALAVAEPAVTPIRGLIPTRGVGYGAARGAPEGRSADRDGGFDASPSGRNARNFLLLGPEPFADAHYATFPSAIPRFAIRAGCPPRVCAACGAPWRRVTEDSPAYAALKAERGRWGTEDGDAGAAYGRRERGSKGAASGHELAALGPTKVTTGWSPQCACGPDAGTVPGLVLDPFLGSGTTAAVAVAEGRRWMGIDLDCRSVGWVAERLAKTQIRLPLDMAAGD